MSSNKAVAKRAKVFLFFIYKPHFFTFIYLIYYFIIKLSDSGYYFVNIMLKVEKNAEYGVKNAERRKNIDLFPKGIYNRTVIKHMCNSAG